VCTIGSILCSQWTWVVVRKLSMLEISSVLFGLTLFWCQLSSTVVVSASGCVGCHVPVWQPPTFKIFPLHLSPTLAEAWVGNLVVLQTREFRSSSQNDCCWFVCWFDFGSTLRLGSIFHLHWGKLPIKWLESVVTAFRVSTTLSSWVWAWLHCHISFDLDQGC